MKSKDNSQKRKRRYRYFTFQAQIIKVKAKIKTFTNFEVNIVMTKCILVTNNQVQKSVEFNLKKHQI